MTLNPLGCLALLILITLAGCETPANQGLVGTNQCFLADTEVKVYSEINQRDQRVRMSFELVDGVKPGNAAVANGMTGHWIPAGPRRVQFRVFLQKAGWNDGGSREARAAVDVTLQPGRYYKVSGDFKDGIRNFQLVDAVTGEVVTELIDIGFFAPIRGPGTVGPIIIPIIKS